MGVCRITHPQASQVVTHLEQAGLTPELAAQVVESKGNRLAKAMVEVVGPRFVTPLHDDEVPEQFAKYLDPWHRMGFDDFGRYRGPVVCRVAANCRLAEDCPRLGPCQKDWTYLAESNWARGNDEPTKEAIVFFIPRIVPGSLAKSVDKQMDILEELRQKHGLPSHHLTSFGDASLDAALVFAHYKRTGERIPEKRLWVRTRSYLADCSRLILGGFDERGLVCHECYYEDDRFDDLGCFALGVEGR